MSNFPSVITSFTNPAATDRLNAPSHSAIEVAQNSGLTQVQTFLGVEGPASTLGTLIYDVRSPGSDGGGHVQAVNKGGTGLIAYNKGDVLVAQSASVLSKLAVGGTNGYALIVDNSQSTGLTWGIPNSKPTVRIYSVASNTCSIFTWAKPSTLSYITVQVQAAGGSGASVLANNTAGRGGSASGYAFNIYAASLLGATEQIRVSASEPPGSASSSCISSFGITNAAVSILSNPGSNGNVGSGTISGGTALGGVINLQGGSSKKAMSGLTNVSSGGDGGESQLGKAGSGGYQNISAPTAPTGFGSGGGGSSTDGSGNTSAPTRGADGVVIVTEY